MEVLAIVILCLSFGVFVFGVFAIKGYVATAKELEETDSNDYSHYFKNLN